MKRYNMAIKKGDIAVVEYTGTFDDGRIFDSSKGRAPLEFEVGSGKVIKGFDDALIGMEKNEEKEIRIEAKDAYGERNEALVKEIPKKAIPPTVELKEGLVLVLKTPEGRQIGAIVKEVKKDTIVIDLNHPLSGKALNFKIKLIDIK